MTNTGAKYLRSFDCSKADGARWIDQKVTFDNLFEVSSAVSSYTMLNDVDWFTRKMIQQSLSLEEAMTREYGKPSLQDQLAANEYDKLISQNLNTLANAGVLESEKVHQNKRRYRVVDRATLDRIGGNPDEARFFLIEYIEWSLNRLGWWPQIQSYLDSDLKNDDLQILKKNFTKLAINTLNLGQRGSSSVKVEAGRIFSKVLNPIAYAKLVPGVELGRISKVIPSRFELSYNRPNWRDARVQKPKSKTRKAYALELKQEAEEQPTQAQLTRAKKKVRDYHGSQPEMFDASGGRASHIHHIFPAHEFPSLEDTLENLIALTPGQHLGEAHPNGNTSTIDVVYQRNCLVQKLNSIKSSVDQQDGMYNYADFARVLETGWGLNPIEPNYSSLRQAILEHVV